jgi:uncharacterized protein YdcH (DUF465 family)
MQKSDRELLLELAPINTHLQELIKEHRRLEKQVQQCNRYVGCSPATALRQTTLKKAKLKIKDQIIDILNEHRSDYKIAVNQ